MRRRCSTFARRSSSTRTSPRPMAWRRAATSWRKVSGWLVDRAEDDRRGRAAGAARGRSSAATIAVALTQAGMALALRAGELDDGARADRACTRAQSEPGIGAGCSARWPRCGRAIPRQRWNMSPAPCGSARHDPHSLQRMQAAARRARISSPPAMPKRHPGRENGRETEPSHMIAASIVAANCALSGRLDEARAAMARLRQLDPTLRASNLREVDPAAAARGAGHYGGRPAQGGAAGGMRA